MLREYQQRSIDAIYDWFNRNSKGHPCLVMPTGSGKSWVIAAFCRDALQKFPDTRVLMLTHQKELIAQNAEKMRLIWPNAPLGIYSASLRRRDAEEPITFAGIQSVRNKADMLGHVDLVIIDECHLLNNDQQGGYRKLLKELSQVNNKLRVIGLTASPYRLGQGLLTEGDQALFTDIIDPVTIDELIAKGYLAPLRSKRTQMTLDVSKVKKRGGEFIESDLAKAIDNPVNNEEAVQEIIARAGDRKSWIVFCSGVAHAENIAEEISRHGISAACITGKTPRQQRDDLLSGFKAGRIQALTNANILTTGFDAPNTDLVAMLRPTMSPALYLQMAGRGMRPKEHTDHCLVLDFAANVERHGPITNIKPPKKSGSGEAPVKVCPECDEVVHLSAKTCPACGHEFQPVEEDRKWRLSNEDIMGMDGSVMNVTEWSWARYVGKRSGKVMIKLTYYGRLSDQPVPEFLTIVHPGYAGQKARRTLASISSACGVTMGQFNEFADDDEALIRYVCQTMNSAAPPRHIEYTNDGHFYQVLERIWRSEQHAETQRA